MEDDTGSAKIILKKKAGHELIGVKFFFWIWTCRENGKYSNMSPSPVYLAYSQIHSITVNRFFENRVERRKHGSARMRFGERARSQTLLMINGVLVEIYAQHHFVWTNRRILETRKGHWEMACSFEMRDRKET
jgi:hypothetical protein